MEELMARMLDYLNRAEKALEDGDVEQAKVLSEMAKTMASVVDPRMVGRAMRIGHRPIPATPDEAPE